MPSEVTTENLLSSGLVGRPWVRDSSYWTPSRIVTSAWLEHAPFAFWIMDILRPKILVELGTHNGFSFFAFCEAAERLGLDTELFAVDTWAGDFQAGFYDQSVFAEVEAANVSYPNAKLCRGYFQDFVGQFEDGTIELLHIDGRHTYDDVKEDFESWLPKVAQGGVVLFHDVVEHDRDFGVWRLWEEVSEKYPTFSFGHGHGLGVLLVGSPRTDALKSFFELDGDQAGAVSATYARLGSQISKRHDELEQKNAQVETLEHELRALRASSSWRVTEPLRKLVDVGRKLRPHARRG